MKEKNHLCDISFENYSYKNFKCISSTDDIKDWWQLKVGPPKSSKMFATENGRHQFLDDTRSKK